ncbi:MAG: ribonuclease P protein component [Endozoicomonadaceae bacterium]|nr:ribonuclease P protein component [Endozoicomonadaceae bacterium]
MSFSFSYEHKLSTSAEFKQVFDIADIKVSNKHLLILGRHTTRGISRLGLVIGKKNIRFAVERNRVKRMLRETFRLNQASIEQLDIVVIARKGLDTLSNKQLQSLLNKQWFRIKQQSGFQKHSLSAKKCSGSG